MRFLEIAYVGIISASAASAAPIQVEIGCPRLPVRSMSKSISFFTTNLGFKVSGESELLNSSSAHVTHLVLGDECLDLVEYRDTKSLPFPNDSQSNDLWFQHIAIVVADMDKAYQKLRASSVQSVSSGPQTLPVTNKQAAGISAFYFRDPDGHFLELIHYPPDKGQKKWQQAKDAGLFLGIDHTAIAVSNTSRSLEFYRDKLHMRVVGESENFGLEQEHLNGVSNSHVLITSLRGDSGIGIEFLEYITPRSGRSIPKHSRLSDLASWEVPITISSPGQSPGDQEMKDPDGHWVHLIQKLQSKGAPSAQDSK